MSTTPVDPQADLLIKVAVNVITEVFKTCLHGLESADKWLRGKSREYDPFGFAADRYARQFEERYDSIRIFGMTHPVSLRSVYVSVNILHKITAEQRASLEDLERFLDYDQRSFGVPVERSSGLSAVQRHNRLMVLGKPGAGKSTFLKHTALYSLDDKLDPARIPVFIGLKDWSDTGEPLLAYITKQFDICGFPDALLFVERILAKGGALLLFDGLDEITEDVENRIRDLKDFTDKYDSNQHVISCRIAAYNYVFPRFTDIEIADFSDSQIRQFINNWFGKGSKKAQACWVALERHSPTRELASLPLLLTLLCLAFDEAMEFPANRAELYKEAVDALLKKWDSSRAIKRHLPYRRLTLKHKEALLSRIAMRSFEKREYFFPRQHLVTQIANYLANLGLEADEEVDAEAILQAIIAQHGLFIERAKGFFSFLHLTFQEYFSARYVVDHQQRRTVEILIKEHWSDRRWREVILLCAGMMAEADELVWFMLNVIDNIQNSGTVKVLLALLPHFDYPRGWPHVSDEELIDLLEFLGALKDHAIREQNWDLAAGCRDLERVTMRIIKEREVGSHSVQAREAGDSGLGAYIHAVDLLSNFLTSSCYVTVPTRRAAEQGLRTWEMLNQTIIGFRI